MSGRSHTHHKHNLHQHAQHGPHPYHVIVNESVSYSPQPEVKVDGFMNSLEYDELYGGERGTLRPRYDLTQTRVCHTSTMAVVCGELRERQ